MEPVGLRTGSKIEIFDFAGHTILSLISLLPARAMLLRALIGGGVSPFSVVRMGLIYRKIEEGSRRGDLNLPI